MADADFLQGGQLLERLDALGDDREFQPRRERHDARGNRRGNVVRAQVGDEAAIEFDRPDREATEVGQRRVAAAEVVECHRDARGLQPRKHVSSSIRIMHQRGLGKFQSQLLGACPGSRQRLQDVWDERRYSEFARRKIHPDPAVFAERSDLTPRDQLLADVVEHPSAERNDQTGFLGQL